MHQTESDLEIVAESADLRILRGRVMARPDLQYGEIANISQKIVFEQK